MSSSTISIPELRQSFDGRVIAPGDESYDCHGTTCTPQRFALDRARAHPVPRRHGPPTGGHHQTSRRGRGISRTLRKDVNGAGHVGFLGDEGPERVRAAYPGSTWDRLAAIKATYDPTNLFHGNQNIPPAR